MNKEHAELIAEILKKISIRTELIQQIRSEGAVKSTITERLIELQDSDTIEKIHMLTNTQIIKLLEEKNEQDMKMLNKMQK